MLSFKQWLLEAYTSPDTKLRMKKQLNHGLMIVPYTRDACIKYATNTKWCIAYKKDSNYWNDYIGKQKLTPYIIIVDPEFEKELYEKYRITHFFNNFNGQEWKIDLSRIAIMIDKDNDVKHIWDAKDENITDVEVKLNGEIVPEGIWKILNDIGVDENTLKHLDSELEDIKTYITFDDIYNAIDKLIEEYKDDNKTITNDLIKIKDSKKAISAIMDTINITHDPYNVPERYLIHIEEILDDYSSYAQSVLSRIVRTVFNNIPKPIAKIKGAV